MIPAEQPNCHSATNPIRVAAAAQKAFAGQKLPPRNGTDRQRDACSISLRPPPRHRGSSATTQSSPATDRDRWRNGRSADGRCAPPAHRPGRREYSHDLLPDSRPLPPDYASLTPWCYSARSISVTNSSSSRSRVCGIQRRQRLVHQQTRRAHRQRAGYADALPHPLESCRGQARANSVSPVSVNTSATHVPHARHATDVAPNTNDTLPATVRHGRSEKSWNT